MNLKQMTAFSELMLTGSVTEAARNLNRTQPAVSHQIASLEESLGMKLFERRKGRLHPVPEARYLFEECSDLLRRLTNVSQNMRRMKAMDRGELRMASMPGPSVFLLPELIARQLGPHPEVKCTLLSRSSDAVFQLVGSQQYDLGVADYDPESKYQTALVDVRVFRFDCLCAVQADHPLASQDCITPADLDGEPMALLFPEHRTHRDSLATFVAERCRLNLRFVTQYFIPLLTYVERGMAHSIVDPLTKEAHRLYRGDSNRIAFRRFEPAIEFSIAVLMPKYKPASLLALAFSELLAQEFTRLGAVEIDDMPQENGEDGAQAGGENADRGAAGLS